jgi:hypothetical protein
MKFIKITGKKNLYDVYQDDSNNLLIQGKTQIGNDHIINNAHIILGELLNINNNDLKKKLIWLHGHGPSPHFILYKCDNSTIDNLELEIFIKSKCSKKSELNKALSCCMLDKVKKTDIPGLVYIENKKLTDLLL